MIDGLRPYPAMKDSGVPWLGQVPEHWQVSPAFAAYRPRQVKNTGMVESTVLSLSYGRIIVKAPEKLRGLVPESFETYQIVEPGNIIVRTTDLQNDQTSLRVGHAHHRGIITAAYMCLETKPIVLNEFGYQYLNAYDLLKIIYGFGSGLRQNLDFSDIKRMPVLVPPRDEQAAIVRFLEHADRRIRRYIRAKQKLIKLLEEQKQAIIHRAVTRGLDPNVRLKPSGVGWLGDVPEQWEVRRLRSVAHIMTGDRDTVDRVDDGQYPFFVRSQTVERINSWAFDGEAVLTAGDGAGVAKVFHYVNGKFDYHQRVYKFSEFRGILGSFFFEYVRATLKFEALAGNAKSTVDSLRRPMLQNFPVVVPSKAEQAAIVHHLQRAVSSVDTTIERARNEIDLLREYRTRLIADVVTGKLDVREAAARLPDEADESEPLDESECETDPEEADVSDIDDAPEEAET